MWNFIKQVFMFRVAQRSTHSMARAVGLGRVGVILGLIAGYRAMRRPKHTY